MMKRSFDIVTTSATPHIVVTECAGDLVVRGSEEQQIVLRARASGDDVLFEQDGDTLTLSSRSSIFLNCPTGTSLDINTVMGDLKIKEIDGTVNVERTMGDMVVHGAGAVTMGEVNGSIDARGIKGDLKGTQVMGDLRAYQIEGMLSMDAIYGSLRAGDIQKGLQIDQISSSARLYPPFSPGEDYRLDVGGSLRVYFSPDASVRLSLQSAVRVRSHLPGLVLQEDDGQTTGSLGDGEATLEAEVAGTIRLMPYDPDEQMMDSLGLGGLAGLGALEEFGTQIEQRIADAMAEMETHLEEGLRHARDWDSLQRIDKVVEDARDRAEHAAGHARHKAERVAEKARIQAERAAERARMQAERAERRWQRASGYHVRRSPISKVSDEERLQVLRLVEEGKITPEQAADLLAAMEGR